MPATWDESQHALDHSQAFSPLVRTMWELQKHHCLWRTPVSEVQNLQARIQLLHLKKSLQNVLIAVRIAHYWLVLKFRPVQACSPSVVVL